MLASTLRRVAAAPLALLVAIFAVVALTSTGVAVAGRQHDDTSTPRTENDVTNLTKVKDRVRLYYGDFVDANQDAARAHQASPTSDYAREVARVERRASSFLAHPRGFGRRHHAPAGKPAIVLDVDDTSVLTYEYDANNDFGFIPSVNAQYVAHGFPAVSGARAFAESKGFHIVANFGDHLSDLKGGFSDAVFKLPNPMYLLP